MEVDKCYSRFLHFYFLYTCTRFDCQRINIGKRFCKNSIIGEHFSFHSIYKLLKKHHDWYIFTKNKNELIFTDSVHFYQTHEVDMSQFKNNQRLLRLKIHYYDKDQNRYTITKPFFFGDVAAASQTLRERCHTRTVDVAYPIIPLNKIDQNIIQNCGLVVVDNNQPSEFLAQLRDRCPVKTTADGFQYKGEFHAGVYCIMQILQNPFNENYDVLYINTNNTTLYNKNIFTRNLILPTYVNGRHPYLNNDILIYCKNQYFAVFDKNSNDDLYML